MADQIDVSVEDRAVAPKKAGQSRWGRRLLTLLIATAAVGGFAVVVIYSYDKGQSVGNNTAVPIITAQKGPTKMRPKEPGGMAVPNRDKQVYGRLNVAERPTKIERLLPPPETVVSRPPAMRESASPPSQVAVARQSAEQIAKKLTAIEPAAGNSNAPPPALPAMRDVAEMAAETQPSAKAPVVAVKPTQESLKETLEVARLATSAKTAAMPTAPAFRIQLASVRSEKAAEKAWKRFKNSHAALFGKLEPKIVRVDLKGKGTFYRLQAGPLADASAARSLCSQAKKRKIGCIIVRP